MRYESVKYWDLALRQCLSDVNPISVRRLFIITWVVRGGEDCYGHPRVSNLSVVELSEKKKQRRTTPDKYSRLVVCVCFFLFKFKT